ncbi:MAG: hypothetical protein JSW67_00050 [Candidatus Latescibacterota bacterium]|nr:MAG: hypothetical protein JSW67_00050 [Candidatus Latescibacterota bacterium]
MPRRRTLRSRWRARGVALALLCSCGVQEAPEPAWEACANLSAPAIAECSGVIHSRRHPGVLWVHNDSGDLPRLFAVDLSGTLLREVHVDGAQNVDWEDIAADDAGHLYIGDFGNNRNTRQDLLIYVIDEPDPRADSTQSALSVPVQRRIPFHFPEQRAFPDPLERNFDCEALFWDAGWLYVLTKHRSDTRTVLYRVSPQGDSLRAAVRLGEYEIGSQVTSADLANDGRRLVVLSYQYIHVFERPAQGDNFLGGRSQRVLIEARQCEGICFHDDTLLLTNEQREVFCVDLDALLQKGRFLPPAPEVDVPRVTAGAGIAALPAPAGILELRREPWVRREPAQPPSLRLGWSESGLSLHLTCPVDGDVVLGSQRLLQLMLGPEGERPALEPGQCVWEVALHDGEPRIQLLLPRGGRGAAATGHVALERNEGSIDVDALIPLQEQPTAGQTLGFNVIVYQPGTDAALEWSWAGSRSTQPLENPLLWGRVHLQP